MYHERAGVLTEDEYARFCDSQGQKLECEEIDSLLADGSNDGHQYYAADHGDNDLADPTRGRESDQASQPAAQPAMMPPMIQITKPIVYAPFVAQVWEQTRLSTMETRNRAKSS